MENTQIKNIIKILNKEIIKKLLIGKNLDNTVLKEYNKINKIKEESNNRVKNIRLSKSYKEYYYNNRIYKWNNNKLINNINIDNTVKLWLKYLFNSKILTNNNNNNNSSLTTIYNSEPIFLHTNDKLNIYIRILIPKYNSYHFNRTINKLTNNYNTITILNKIYNKKVNIIPIFIRNSSIGLNEFIIGHNSIYSPYKSHLAINKLNKYIVSKSTINNNTFININSLYNILYFNNIYNILFINNYSIKDFIINNINTILPNINYRYITGYNFNYHGKLPKADSSSRTIKRYSITGTLHNNNADNFNTTNKTFYSYNNNGLAATKATIAQAPTSTIYL